MTEWVIKRTDHFLKNLKHQKNNHELLEELDKRIRKLSENPIIIGGQLAGNLHGKQSTRLAGKYRLLFQVDVENKVVYLIALDHRRKVY